MTTTPQPGDQLTWNISGVSYLTDASLSGGERVSRRGETFTLTAQLIEANQDRNGASLFDIAHDEDAQLARWGHVLMLPGEVELSAWTPGTVEQELAREARRLAAHAEPDDARRAEKLRDLEREFGPVKNPSGQTSSWMPGDLERDAMLRAEGRK